MAITLSIFNGYSKFFHFWKRSKFPTKPVQHFPSYLQHVAALPCEI